MSIIPVGLSSRRAVIRLPPPPPPPAIDKNCACVTNTRADSGPWPHPPLVLSLRHRGRSLKTILRVKMYTYTVTACLSVIVTKTLQMRNVRWSLQIMLFLKFQMIRKSLCFCFARVLILFWQLGRCCVSVTTDFI